MIPANIAQDAATLGHKVFHVLRDPAVRNACRVAVGDCSLAVDAAATAVARIARALGSIARAASVIAASSRQVSTAAASLIG